MCTEPASGQHRLVRDVLGKDIADLMELRMRVRMRLQIDPLYRYSLCDVAVHVCSSPNRRRFFFKHREQDGSCPANTSGEHEINARKYKAVPRPRRALRRGPPWGSLERRPPVSMAEARAPAPVLLTGHHFRQRGLVCHAGKGCLSAFPSLEGSGVRQRGRQRAVQFVFRRVHAR